MKEKEKKQENMDVKKHLTPEDDEKLHEAYINALGEILENDDDDARDNLANYMDEVKEESDVLGTEPDENDLDRGKTFPYFIVSTGFIREALNACHATVSVPITTAAIPIKINDTGEISFL